MGFFNDIIKSAGDAAEDLVKDALGGGIKTGNTTIDEGIGIIGGIIGGSNNGSSGNQTTPTRSNSGSSSHYIPPRRSNNNQNLNLGSNTSTVTRTPVRGTLLARMNPITPKYQKKPTEKKYFGMSLTNAVITGFSILLSGLGLYFTIKKK